MATSAAVRPTTVGFRGAQGQNCNIWLIRLKRTWGRKVGNPRGAFSEQRGET